jgi:hypothetical protein
MSKEKIYAEQIVIVTDEGENVPPYFGDAWAEYSKSMNSAPSVIIVQVGGSNPGFVKGLQQKGIEVLRFAFKGDYYSLPNVLPLLAMPSRAELVDLIMERDLPRRPILVKAS